MKIVYILFILSFSFLLSVTSARADLVDPGLIPPINPSNPTDWGSIIISGGIVAIVVLVSVFILKRIKNKKNVPNK